MGTIILTEAQVEHCAEFQLHLGLELTPFNGCYLRGNELTVAGKTDVELAEAIKTFNPEVARADRAARKARKLENMDKLRAMLARDGLDLEDLKQAVGIPPPPTRHV